MFLKGFGIVGLLFRDNFVHVLQCSSQSQNKARTIGKAQIPSGVIVDFSVVKPKVLADVIRSACRNAAPYKINNGMKVVFTVPESKTFIRIMTLPHIDDDKLSEAIRWEIEDYVPLGIDDIYYDWQSIPNAEGQNDDSSTVVIVASAKSVVDTYINSIEMAGLYVVGVEADSIADTRALRTKSWDDKNIMIFSFDNLQSRISIVASGIPIFTVTIPVGLSHFISSIKQFMNVSEQEATRMILSDGIGSYITRDPLFFALKPSLTTLTGEINKSIEFCHQTLPHCTTVPSIIFCGVGAKIKGLRAFLIKDVGTPITVASPWKNVQILDKKIPILSRSESLEVITVIGSSIKKFTYADVN